MAGYIGSKTVNLSTTGADIAGDADVSGALDVGGAFTSQGIDDNATSTAMTLDASGNLLVGKTALGIDTNGFDVRPTGETGISVDDNIVLDLNRTSEDGKIINLRKDDVGVGVIGVKDSTNAYIGSGAAGFAFAGSGPTITPYNTTANNYTDNTVDLGNSFNRFKDLYLSGGVYLGGTGSANLLDDYEEGSFTPTVADAASGGNTSPSYSTRVGFYTKVGRNVNIHISVTNISTSGLTSGNGLFIQGLPFLQSNTNGRSCTGSVRADRLNVESTCFGVIALVGQGSSTVQLYQNRDNTTDIPVEIGDILSGQADLFISINYDT